MRNVGVSHDPVRPTRLVSPWTTATLASVVMLTLGAGLMSLALAHPPTNREAGTVVTRLVNPAEADHINALIDQIQHTRVVMVGETHDRYDHHLNQLAIIRGLHERGVPIAVGMEYFQRPFQQHLDAFSAGAISQDELLTRTEWDQRWRFDVRLYQDILRYAQQHRLPLVALNASTETVSAVSNGGIDALDAAHRGFFPAQIELASGAYRRQLEQVFMSHSHLAESHRQRFLEVQYLWDQTMARTAGDYLTANPGRTLVLLAGSGHLLHDEAIPERLRRINPASQTVVVTDTGYMPAGARPDYVFTARDLSIEDGAQIARLARD